MKEALKIFKALADETRLKIVESLLNGEKCVCEIVLHIKRAQSTVSIQLAKLESLGIVESRREGKSVYYNIANPKIREILNIVEGKKDMVSYDPIGIIHTPFKKPKGAPIQSSSAKGIEGIVEVFTEYVGGLKDLEGFSHIILIYHFHLSKKGLLQVKPYMDDQTHGVFATRAPSRPNPIGISVVRLVRIDKNIIHIKDVDIVNGTPLLDIKPYVPEFDVRKVERIGWLQDKIHELSASKDDGRFV